MVNPDVRSIEDAEYIVDGEIDVREELPMPR